MKAIVYHKYGSPDVLELEDIDKPVVTDDDVLVRVRAASVNPFDWHFMRGTPYIVRLMAGVTKPKTTRLGVDVIMQKLLEARTVTPVIDRTYPLSEAPEAIRYLEQGHARGKVVITVGTA